VHLSPNRPGRLNYAAQVAKNYLLSRKWALTDQFAITDETGAPQFEVQGRLRFSRTLTIRDIAGREAAVLSKGPWSRGFEISAGGHRATVRPRGFLGQHFEIESGGDHLEARGNFSGRQYVVARAGVPVAAISQQRSLRERFAVQVEDGEDPVLQLAVVLAIETIRADRRRAGMAGG
jgi:uncharacterized protein YxjI